MTPEAGATGVGGIAILLWASLAFLTAASGAVPPFQLAAITFAIGGSLGLAVALARGRLGVMAQPPRVWALGVGGLFGYHALYFGALRLAPPAQAGLIAYLWPLLIVVLSASLPGERLRRRHLVGAGLGFAGVMVLLAGSGGVAIEARYAAGYALALGCAVVWSAYSVLSRRFRAVPTEAVAGFCLVTALLAGLCHALFETTILPTRGSEIAAIAALGAGPVGLAFYVWDIGVKRGDIRLLGVAAYAAPVLSTLTLVATGYTAPTAALWIACALIVVGAAVASMAAPQLPALPNR